MYTYEELKHFVDNCGHCPLAATRNKSVMGKGNLESPIMFIAEAPGNSEDRDGIPFTGPSGRVFDELLESVGMSREEIYLTNVVKCHPPHNRDPFPQEQEACIPYYKRARNLFISKNTWLTAVYHPSAILRDPEKMEEAKRDFKQIKEKADTLL